jgi:hypothetical protein
VCAWFGHPCAATHSNIILSTGYVFEVFFGEWINSCFADIYELTPLNPPFTFQRKAKSSMMMTIRTTMMTIGGPAQKKGHFFKGRLFRIYPLNETACSLTRHEDWPFQNLKKKHPFIYLTNYVRDFTGTTIQQPH